MKEILIRRRRGRWGAHWRRADGMVGIGRYGDTPELALIHLLAAEGPGRSSIEDGVIPLFREWCGKNGLTLLRLLLLAAKGDGWDDRRNLAAVETYREYRKDSTAGTLLNPETYARYVCSALSSEANGKPPVC